MDCKLLLDTAVMAGELMLESGAETYRVEDTMHRMLMLSGLKTAEVFVTTTGIIVTLDDPSTDSMTVVRRIRSIGTNLNRIHLVNNISRSLCSGELSLEEAFRQIRDIRQQNRGPKANLIATALVTASFTLTFGGTFWEVVIAAAAGALMAACLFLCRKYGVPSFLSTLLGAAVVSVCAVLGARIYPVPALQDHVIVGSIMPLVPGVAITNAVFDTLNGDYLSGTARALEAFVTAAAVALGIVLGLGLLL